MPFNLDNIFTLAQTGSIKEFNDWLDSDEFNHLSFEQLKAVCSIHKVLEYLSGCFCFYALSESGRDRVSLYFLLVINRRDALAEKLFQKLNARLLSDSGDISKEEAWRLRCIMADSVLVNLRDKYWRSCPLLLPLEVPGSVGTDVARFSFYNILSYLTEGMKKNTNLDKVRNMKPRLEVLFKIVSEMVKRREVGSTDYLDLFLTHARGLEGFNHRRWRGLFPGDIKAYPPLWLMQVEMANVELVVRHVQGEISEATFNDCLNQYGEYFAALTGRVATIPTACRALATAWKAMELTNASVDIIEYNDPKNVVLLKTIDTVLAGLSHEQLDRAFEKTIAIDQKAYVAASLLTIPLTAGLSIPAGIVMEVGARAERRESTLPSGSGADRVMCSPQARLLTFLEYFSELKPKSFEYSKLHCLDFLYTGGVGSSSQIETNQGLVTDAIGKLKAIIERGAGYSFMEGETEHMAMQGMSTMDTTDAAASTSTSTSTSKEAAVSDSGVVVCDARFFANKNNAAQLAALELPPSLWTRFKGP